MVQQGIRWLTKLHIQANYSSKVSLSSETISHSPESERGSLVEVAQDTDQADPTVLF